MSDWVPIRYRGFHDVPRAVVVRSGARGYLLWSDFLDDADEYSDHYRVVILDPVHLPDPPTAVWLDPASGGTEIGTVPVAAVVYDPTLRRAVDAALLTVLDSVGSALPDVLERLRAAAIAQDADRSAALYAEDAVHEFPFTTPGGPTRIEGRAAIAEFLATVYRSLPLQYTEYRTIAVHRVDGTTLVVEQEALGVNTQTGARFALPNVAVIDLDPQGLIARLRDYANPVAVAAALGHAPRL